MRVLEMQGWAEEMKESKKKITTWRINPAVHDGRFAQIAEMEGKRREEARENIARGSREPRK
jgi:hypothetical protein